MTTQGKPPVSGDNRDMLCPMFRKPLRKVCHRCEFFEILPMNRVTVDPITQSRIKGEGFEHWGCTLKHQTLAARDLGISFESLRQETERFGNKVYAENQKNLEALIQIVGSAEQTIHRAAQTLDALPTQPMRQINWNVAK